MEFSHLLRKNYTIIVPSNKPHKVEALRGILPDVDIIWFDGSGYPSWTKLWNEAVVASPTDLVIICQDKARPTMVDIEKSLRLVDEGFGTVQMYCLGFVSFSKYVLDVIGWMDERLNGSGHHDCLIRHKEADVAYYESLEVEYERSSSTWSFDDDSKFLYEKWDTDSRSKPIDYERRKIPDEVYDYQTNAKYRKFLPYSKSVILTGNTKLFERRFLR